MHTKTARKRGFEIQNWKSDFPNPCIVTTINHKISLYLYTFSIC